ncbi:MAG: glycosyl hydrolase family 28-related protein [Pseudonocardiaceae bacterium]
MQLNIRDFGAKGNGVDDDSTAWREAMASLSADGGGDLYVPPGVYKMPPFGNASWCCDLTADNVRIIGVPGASIIRMPAGMPARSVSLIRANLRTRIALIGLTLDGNWGAVVGTTDDHLGHNHETQEDPKSHALMIRGCTDVTIRDCRFVQTYGDHVWMGHGADPNSSIRSFDVRIEDCRGDVSARNGLTLGGRAARVRIRDSAFSTIYSQALDFEPQTSLVEDVQISGSFFGLWWNPHRSTFNSSVTVDGGTDESLHARYVRIDNCRIEGCLLIQRAKDVHVRGCRIETMWGGVTWSPVHVRFHCDDILFERNTILDNCIPPGRYSHDGSIHIQYYGAGVGIDYQPRNIMIAGNTIRTQRGVHGIHVNGTAGGLVRLEGNLIDLTDTGNGQGGRGIDLFAERPGMRVATRGNRIRNANGAAVRARFTSPANTARSILLESDHAWDDQLTHTCTSVVQIDSPQFSDNLAASTPSSGGGIPVLVSGLPA